MFITAFVVALSSAICYLVGATSVGLAKLVSGIISSVFGSLFDCESQTVKVITVIIICAAIVITCSLLWGMTGFFCAIGFLIFQMMAEND